MSSGPNITTQNGNLGGQNLQAAGFMLGAVLFISFIPLVITQGGGIESPFLFNAGWRLGTAVGCLSALLAFYRPVLLAPQVISLVASSALSWALLGATINSLEYALFAWSIQFVAIPVAAVLLELWPIGFILLTARLLRYRRSASEKYPFHFSVSGHSLYRCCFRCC